MRDPYAIIEDLNRRLLALERTRNGGGGSPVATVIAWAGAGTGAAIPTGHLECNGQAVSRTTFAALFAIIGTKYGAGNGSTTYNLPSGAAGHVLAGIASTVNTRANALTSAAQSANHTHTGTSGVQSATHTHTATVGTQSANHTHAVSINTGANSANHTHTNADYYSTGPNSSATKTTSSQSANHTHLVSGNTGANSANHTHTVNLGTQSANHTHTTTTGVESANHTHAVNALEVTYLIKY